MQYQSSLFGLLRKGAALLLCLCLLAGCTNQQQEQPQLASSTGTEPEQTEESTSSHEVDAEYYLGETTFIGDSRTNGLLTYQLTRPSRYLPSTAAPKRPSGRTPSSSWNRVENT